MQFQAFPSTSFLITCCVQIWKKPTYCKYWRQLGAGLGESMVGVIQVTPEYILVVKLVLRDDLHNDITCEGWDKLRRCAMGNVWEFCTPLDNHCCNL